MDLVCFLTWRWNLAVNKSETIPKSSRTGRLRWSPSAGDIIIPGNYPNLKRESHKPCNAKSLLPKP